MQEEEDNDEEAEPSSPLNRRGSKSEGRICITVQDRLSAEVAERLKREQLQKIATKEAEEKQKAKAGIIQGISGIKIIKNDNKEKILGQAGGGNQRKEIRSCSVEKMRLMPSRVKGEFKVLSESATIPSPLCNTSSGPVLKPYKTLPAPARPLTIVTDTSAGSSCLKEIFEEGGAGSSDNSSNTNTPRALLRSQASATQHRRTKFHKSRTTSGSSTDGSDDDSAEKKRVAKIIDSQLAKSFTQRRDSHDGDSSDSQDPGGTSCSGNNNVASSLILRNGSSSTSTNNKTTTPSGSGGQERGKTTSNSTEMGYRKHRTGRRRQTETRLRESQSLNRITEVQENESNNILNAEKLDKPKDVETPQVDEDDVKSVTIALNEINIENIDATGKTSSELKANKNNSNHKAKGFSARFLQNFKRSHDYSTSAPINSVKVNQKSNRNSMPEVPLVKLNSRATPAAMPDNSDRSKKIKILGRYFQVL